MGIDALWWAQEAVRLGAGEICLNSIDADGTQAGYELTLTRMISEAVTIPVIASGRRRDSGASLSGFDRGPGRRGPHCLHGSLRHLYHHSRLKQYLHRRGIPVRLSW